MEENIDPQILIPQVDVDCEILFSDIDDEFRRSLNRFQPFGPGNPSPVFATYGVSNHGDAKLVGVECEHLRMDLIQRQKPNTRIQTIAFQQPTHYEWIRAGPTYRRLLSDRREPLPRHRIHPAAHQGHQAGALSRMPYLRGGCLLSRQPPLLIELRAVVRCPRAAGLCAESPIPARRDLFECPALVKGEGGRVVAQFGAGGETRIAVGSRQGVPEPESAEVAAAGLQPDRSVFCPVVNAPQTVRCRTAGIRRMIEVEFSLNESAGRGIGDSRQHPSRLFDNSSLRLVVHGTLFVFQ